jgi:hypothetical protein
MTKLIAMMLIAAASGTATLAQSVVDPAPKYPICTYGNRIKGTQKRFPCRVVTNGSNGKVIFIDEYASRSLNSKMLTRHDDKQGWFAPAMRNGECLLRDQGAEYICIGNPWSGI